MMSICSLNSILQQGLIISTQLKVLIKVYIEEDSLSQALRFFMWILAGDAIQLQQDHF
jgi:hypothetical protein